ncbi:T9SS type A sorting domain-containing protein [Lacinutrix sp. C3R15]|uniref:LamG-like jellyroll fold domain-containing protein n=1 Tax=Flavobacteriaceae TaxID=49546 RepID=UPI001C08D6BA|nr:MULTISPECIES: LamG-like jellyroll fold domain-containing protein [Flavobacteriaceae]MBU2940905.1 T9SS type A sorting domain-containing protein [Lacinutrix sp. C3R15]MDO6624224.1 LamG-like jellyroll fold domain-containing protein [Oceanihabitans sp. 1_MG-2023]
MFKNLLHFLVCFIFSTSLLAQTNAPSIQSGVSFQWSDTQTNYNQPATIESITVNSNVYLNFGVPTGYELTQPGTNAQSNNTITLNSSIIENTSASASWNTTALDAFQSLNLNYYFAANYNGQNICNDFAAENSTNAQRATLTYDGGIVASSSGVIAITEQNANNCYHIEFFGIPVGGGPEQSLGETFVNSGGTKWGFGGTGSSGNIGTPGAVNSPPAGSDYWLSDRVVLNRATLGIAIFYLDDIAPTGSTITKATLTAASYDNGDGKMFILTLPDNDKDGLSDVDDLDDDNDGITDVVESGGINPSADHDLDGIPNYQDADFCVLNSFGICANLDFDNDGVPNHFDLDSDNDGIFDVVESGGIDANNDGYADGAEGLTSSTMGIPTSAGTGTTPINTDNTGNYNFLDIDSDDDGIPDNVEAQSTFSYLSPSNSVNSYTGVDTLYTTGLTLEDTDNDGIPDYIDSDSDNDGIPDIQENGMANALSGSDYDNDGLDNIFETSGTNDAIWDVNEAIEDPTDLSVLPDNDGDLFAGGDLDYRDLFDINPPVSATLDFDGVDDYLTGNTLINGLGEVTIMAWVKIDTGNTDTKTIAGEDISCRLYVENGNKLMFGTRTTAGTTNTVNGIQVAYNEWHHVTGVFSGATGTQTIYIDGVKRTTSTTETQVGQTILGTGSWNGSFEIGRLSRNTTNKQYFKGDIDEVRVFDIALTEDQIQGMVYQEIENASGKVRGRVIPKDIIDMTSNATVSWSNLIAYYSMADIKNSTTIDYSGNGNTLNLKNITTLQEQTAPMPYETINDGDWVSENTWLHGGVWDIEDVANNKDWSIVHVKNNVDAAHAVKNIGLFVDTDKTFTVNGDNQVNNSWYLELNGALDLQDDSQLIQGANSDLVTSANGKILRRQEGASSYYWYNYWGSPVGQTGVTALSNNNATANNTNNTSFSVNMLKKGDGSAIQFISGNHQTDRLSTRWMYTYENGVTYYDWGSVNQTTAINPGVGYIHKGMGVGTEQQYLFEGKPNNGTIKLNVSDVGGAGSVPAVSKTEYLLGNPYASAIDIHSFLEDNASVLEGSIQLWQQWDGASHVTTEYEGGYAQVNKTGSVRAYQFEGGEGGNNGSQDGTKLPTKYLPVGQGFMAEIKNSGAVVFKNSQRVFVKEADANGSETNGSVFFRTTDAVSNEPIMQKLRLEFNALDGQASKRELLLGFSDYTTDAYNYGYEAKNTDDNHDDLYLILEDEYMSIQAYAEITDDKIVPLALKTSGNNSYSIKLTETINIAEDQEVYLRDNLTNVYYNLRQDTAYTFTSTAGVFDERFEIVFSSQTLSTEEVAVNNNTVIYYNNNNSLLYVKGLNATASTLSLVNMLGQTVYMKTSVPNNTLENGIIIGDLAAGVYIVSIKTETHQTIGKKIVVE